MITSAAGLLGRLLAGYLTGSSHSPFASMPTDLEALAIALQPGDVLLVDGQQRISTAIKYLTQSTWSHAALCVSGRNGDQGHLPRCVEADAVEGVRVVDLTQYEGLHTRICRPVGLNDDDVRALVTFALGRVGDEYDLSNVIDLARYLLPIPPVPSGWRRRMIALGSGEPTKAICSTLVAQAFQAIRYPILPDVSQMASDDPDCADCVRDIHHIRHHSLFAPRDFDVSPYFQVIKPSLERLFDYRSLAWGDK